MEESEKKFYREWMQIYLQRDVYGATCTFDNDPVVVSN